MSPIARNCIKVHSLFKIFELLPHSQIRLRDQTKLGVMFRMLMGFAPEARLICKINLDEGQFYL